METLTGKHGSALITIPLDQVEETCLEQIRGFLDHPVFDQPIAIMPDTHAGKGSVIGFTMPLSTRVIPNVIGVDIGCGMHSFEIGRNMKVAHADLDQFVRAKVPFGFDVHETPVVEMRDDFPWAEANDHARSFAARFNAEHGLGLTPPRYSMQWFLDKCRTIGIDPRRVMNSIGTLGGGNHFIEIGRSTETENLWVTLHSGSRAFGLKVAGYWQAIAAKKVQKDKKGQLREEVARIKSQTKDKTEIQRLIGEAKRELGLDQKHTDGLEWLEGDEAGGYYFDMIFAQFYAKFNRAQMARVLCKALGVKITREVHSTHNYIDFRDMIIRKGAIRSYEGELMIIPFNMRDGVLICEGRSNHDWNCSAPHGAGRVMSRAQAVKRLKLEDFQAQMKGIFSTSVDAGTLDEAPEAYKDPKLIEEAIAETAHIRDRLIPIHSMKASDGRRARRRRKK